jgi:CelD/BcsL family acetyltransferase involved in cellulose biosynthesis
MTSPTTPVRLRRPDELGAEELDQWRRLAAGAAEPNPFFEPEMLPPAVRHMATEPVWLLTVEDERDGEWIAALPVVRRRWQRPFPGPCVVGWVHRHCYLGTPLMSSGRHDEAARALLSGMEAQGRPRWVGFPALQEGPIATALRAAAAARGRPAVELDRRDRAVLARPGPAGSAALSSRARSELRRRRRRLADALGGPVAVADPPAAGIAERFLGMEHAGWKRDAGTSLLSNPGDAAFFREIAAALGDRLRFFSLETNDRQAAIATSIASGDSEFLFKTAYDERLAQFAPGRLLAVESIDALIADDRRRVDSCAAPDSEFVNSLLPDRRAIVTLAIARGPLTARMLSALVAARALRRQRRRRPEA